MFDTYTHGETKEEQKTVTVHHHNAPTTQSVALLKEFEDCAMKRIVDNIMVKDNSLNFKAIVQQNHIAFEDKLIVKYSINGQEDVFDIVLPDHYEASKKQEYLILIRDRICQKISEKIVIGVVRAGTLDWQMKDLK